MALSAFSWVQVLKGTQVLRDTDEEFHESCGALECRGEGVGERGAAGDAATLEPEARRNTCGLIMHTRINKPLLFGINQEKFIKALQVGKTSTYKPAVPICTCSYTTVKAHKRTCPVGGGVGGGMRPGNPRSPRRTVGCLERIVSVAQGRWVDSVCCSSWGFDINFYFNF